MNSASSYRHGSVARSRNTRASYQPWTLHPVSFVGFATLCVLFIVLLQYIHDSKILVESDTWFDDKSPLRRDLRGESNLEPRRLQLDAAGQADSTAVRSEIPRTTPPATIPPELLEALAHGPKTKIITKTVTGRDETVATRTLTMVLATDLSSSSKTRQPNLTVVSDTPDPHAKYPLLFRLPPELLGQFFLTLLVVVLAFLWKPIALEIKRLEPWYLISSVGGASGKELFSSNLNLNLTNKYIMAPILAYIGRYWCSFTASIVDGPVFMVLQQVSVRVISVEDEGACSAGDFDSNCISQVIIRPKWLRVMQSFLVILGVVVLVLGVMLWWRKRTLLLMHNPHTIAGVARLMTADSQELDDALEDMPATVSDRAFRKALEDTTFRLVARKVGENVTAEVVEAQAPRKPVFTLEVAEEGAMNPDVEDGSSSTTPLAAPRGRGRRLISELKDRHKCSRPLMLRNRTLLVLELFLTCIFVMLVIYRFAEGKRLHWLDSQNGWVKALAILVAQIIQSLWEPLAREVMILEPFRLLAYGHQPAKLTLFADHTLELPVYSTFKALFSKCFYIAFISVVSLSVEALVLFLPAVPFDGGTTWQFWTIMVTSSFVIIFVLFLTVAVVTWRRRRVVLPRMPYDFITTLSYLYRARMLRDLNVKATAPIGAFGEKAWRKEVGAWEKGYMFGWTVGSDGVDRLGVDEELEEDCS